MYLDSANLEEIKQAYQTNLFKGVTTNPTILWKEKKPRFDLLKEISQLEVGELYCQITGETLEERYADYLAIHAFKNHIESPIIVKVAIDQAGLEVIKKIKEHNPNQKILATAVYSATQGILAAIAGVDSIAPYVNRMANNNIDPCEEIKRMREFIDDRNLNTKIIAASFKQPAQVMNALSAGAHTATLPFDVFQAMISNPLVDQAVKVFEEHHKEFND